MRLYSWVADKAAGLDINASRMDADTSDITTNGLGLALTRDGQGSASAPLPMNTFNHTGVGNATARDQYAAAGQIQDGGLIWAVATGSADVITATYAPAITAFADGALLGLRAIAANATTTPTFAPNGLLAHPITKFGGDALAPGDIFGAGHELLLRYRLSATRWELLNPASLSSQIGWAAAGGTADAITATYAPPNAALTDGLLLGVRAGAANATATPTFAPDGLTAHTITKFGGGALVANDIYGANAELLLRYNLANTRWELLNPGFPASVSKVLDLISTTAGKMLQRGASVWAAVPTPSLQSQVFTSSGTFTVPANAISTTVFKFTAVGGGGGGSSASNGSPAYAGSGGGSGGAAIGSFSGFTAGQSVTIGIGAGGGGGTYPNGAGSDGNNSTVTASAVAIITANGGKGGTIAANIGGLAGSNTVTAGASGLTLVSNYPAGASSGGQSILSNLSIANGANGGSNSIGTGGQGGGTLGPTAAIAGTYGGGGGGGPGGGNGAAGGNGVVIVEWVL